MKRLTALLLPVPLLFLSGCSGFIYSDYRPTEGIELIRAIGIDYDQGTIYVTAGSGEGSMETAPKLIKGEGPTMDMALSQIQKNSAKAEAVFSFTEYVLIGEEAARQGIQGYLDYIERSPQLRMKTAVLIVRGTTAGEMLSGVLSGKLSAPDILTSLESYMEDAAVGTVFTCDEIATSLSERGGALVCAVELISSQEETEDKPEKMISPSGYAVIKDGALSEFVDTDTAQAVTALLGDVSMMYLTADDGAGGKLGLRLTDIKRKFQPVLTDGRLTAVNVTVVGDLHIEEVQNDVDILSDEFRRRVESETGEAVTLKLERAIRQAQTVGVDYFDISGELQRSHPLKLRTLEETWPENFPETTFNINVSLNLERTHDIAEPVNVKG
jgi:spore germination protein KC